MVGHKIARENQKVTYREQIIQTDKVKMDGGDALQPPSSLQILDSQASMVDFAAI